jgi:hypothetical protein
MHPQHLPEPLDLDTLNLLRLAIRLGLFLAIVTVGVTAELLAGDDDEDF